MNKKNIINFDIKLYCHDEEYKIIIELELYSENLIKSSTKFEKNKLFKINKTMIEGIYFNSFDLYYLENCKKNGKFIHFHYNNQFNIKVPYKGLNEEFYKNSSKQIECYYKNDRLNGEYYSWFKTGEYEKKCSYTDDLLDGKYTEWYNNKVKYIECYYKKDKLNGKYENWWGNGNKNIEYYYIDNIITGNYNEWNVKGIKI
jgi:antitoxin component YwqK of YwqJK toxin-antitoxin module